MSINRFTYIDFAMRGQGNYFMEQYVGEIPFIGTVGTDLLQLYDLTNTLQIDYDVRIFNEKLGIYKDSSNENIIDASNSLIQDYTTFDYISLSVDDFLNNISGNQVTNLGKFSAAHKDFARKTNTYFGYADGFASIFDASGSYDINDKVFSGEELVQLLKQRHIDGSGNDVYKLSGSLNLYQLANILSFMALNDPFSNRTNKTKFDGFIAGDRILIEMGITIAFELTTYNASYTELPETDNTIILSHIIYAPLLLTLRNLS